jgi:hypothetical protein
MDLSDCNRSPFAQTFSMQKSRTVKSNRSPWWMLRLAWLQIKDDPEYIKLIIS